MSLWTMTDEAAGKPKYLSDDLRNTQTVSDKDSTIGINVAEALDADSAAKGLRTPGWVKYVTYTDSSGNVRHKSEVLVASSSMASDGTETLVDDLGGSSGVLYTAGVDFDSAYPTTVGTTYLQIVKAGATPEFAAAVAALPIGTQLTIGYMDGVTPATAVVTTADVVTSPGPGTFWYIWIGSGGPAGSPTMTTLTIG